MGKSGSQYLMRNCRATEFKAYRGGLCFLGGFFLFFFPTSGTDFHGKAASINMALKPRPFYFVHKDHC